MNRSKFIINITIIAVALIIAIPTVYKIIKNHNDRLIEVTTKRIKEAAKNCKLDEKCTNNKITLKELYDNEYLEKESNPITKEYYNEDSYVEVIDNFYEFVEVK